METLNVVGKYGVEPAGQFGFMGREQLVYLNLQYGYGVEVKPGHRAWASKSGAWDWYHVHDLAPGDSVSLRGGDDLWADSLPLSVEELRHAVSLAKTDLIGVPKNIRTANREDVISYLSQVCDVPLCVFGHEQTAKDIQVMYLNLGRLVRRDGAKIEFSSTHQFTEAGELSLLVVSVDSTGVEDTYDINMPSTSSVVTNGIVSHNSDVRLRQTQRSLSGPKAYFSPKPGKKGGIQTFNEIEPSVEFPGTKDEYKYVHVKAVKNKLWTPDRTGWLRIWKEDGSGKARGIDPVFDTMAYLKDTGQVSGQREKMKLRLEGLGAAKRTVTWGEMKIWVLGDKEQMTKISNALGFKPMSIRAFCFKQMRSGIAEDLFVKSRAAKDSKGGADEDDSGSDDE